MEFELRSVLELHAGVKKLFWRYMILLVVKALTKIFDILVTSSFGGKSSRKCTTISE